MAAPTDIYARAHLAAARDPILLHRLLGAWRAVRALPADATLDSKNDAAHELLVAMLLAFRFQDAKAA